MHGHLRGRRVAGYLAVAAAAALSTTGGWALAASGGRVIHACANKETGALRLAGRCKKKHERAVAWNVQGRPGPQGAGGLQGPQGAQGATGQTGPAGPSDIYADGSATGALTTSYGVYGTVSLPPGSYLLEGQTVAIDSGGGGSEVTCSLAQDTSHVHWDDANSTLTAAGAREVISLSAVQMFSTTQQVEIVCKLRAGTASLDDVRVIAIKTGALHGSTPVD